MTRVPLSELPSTIRQEPSALCKSSSDELSERRVSVSKALASSVKHEGDAISRISCPRSFSVVPQSCPWSCFAYGAFFCEPSEAYGAAASGIGLGTAERRGIPERPFIASAHGCNQKPAKPSGLLYGMATLVTSSSDPSGLVAYPTSFEAFP